MKNHLLTAAVFLVPLSSFSAEPLEAFPPAGEGMVRHVLQLPAKDDESAFRVELVVGKMMVVDTVNKHFFGGRLKAVTVEGWGYTRYVLNDLGPFAGTLIAPPAGAGKVERFVTTGGEPFLIRYNSKLPVVVYVPEGAEVRYRIWSAQGEFAGMDQG